ncbi:MAG: T9SS type A sorting domain-containing protein [Balneola sp.]
MWYGKYRICWLITVQIFCVYILESKAQAVSLTDSEFVYDVRIEIRKAAQKREISAELLREKEYKNIAFGIYNLRQKQQLRSKNIASLSTNDTETFYVRDIRRSQAWVTLDVTLSYQKDKINIWIESGAYDTLKRSSLFEEFLSSLEKRLFLETLPNSVDPNKGVLSLLQEYAGEYPDVDGDGILDIILLDIKDDFDESGSFVAGFFDPVNLIDHEYSNKRDIIYLDLYPTLFYNNEIYTERLLSTLVHEAQHLIHAGYEGDEIETVFANEGFSEAMEILAGFTPRDSKSFFQSPLRNLMSWDYKNPLPDYSRASLWTHYLTEQFGAEILKNLIQNEETGVPAYSREIELLSDLSFQEVFQNWGIALSVNDKALGYEFGYDHPERRNLRLDPIFSSSNLPAVIQGNVPDLSHALISYPLSKEVLLEEGEATTRSVHISSFSTYPDERITPELSKRLTSGDWIFADRYKHGNISLLFSTIESNGIDTLLNKLNFLVEGVKSGVQQKWRYGDGLNDTFYLNASYLTLDSPEQKLGIIFPVEAGSAWLESITLKNVFLSELTGTGVDGNEKRDFELEIFSFKNNEIGQSLILKKYIEVERERGKLVKEHFSLKEFYSQLSSIQDSILIVIGNDPDDQNYIALGMDKSTISSSMHYGEGNWERLSEKSIGSSSLEGWNPMIEANVVVNQKNEIEPGFITSINYDFNNVEVWANPGFEHDTSSVTMIAKLPDGSFETGKMVEKTPNGYRFDFPVQVDGIYLFKGSFSARNGEQHYSSEKEWDIEIPGGFIVSNNYPNPFNPSTNISFTLIERGEVGWQVYDILGRSILEIAPAIFESGEHTKVFNFNGLSSGMYFIRANISRERSSTIINKTKKVMLIK